MRIESTDAKLITTQVYQKPMEQPEEIRSSQSANEKKVNSRNYEMLPEIKRQMLPISEKVVIEAIEKANKAIQGARTTFEFSIHEQTREIMVKVLDRDTGELIREIPPEKILDMIAKMWELAGLIVDERR